MNFCFTSIRNFSKLWKSHQYLGLGPGQSLAVFKDYCGLKNQKKWFSRKPGSPQNTKANNLLIAKAKYLRKGNVGSNKPEFSESPHYFAAGSAKKRSQNINPSKDRALPPVKCSLQIPTKPLTSEEWAKLQADFKGKANFENWMFSQMVRSHSSLDVAKSLLAWVAAKNSGIVGYDLLVKYLCLCVFHKQTSEVIDVYEIMKTRYKSLDSGANTLLIRGLILSDRWREALVLLENIKRVMVPSKTNYNDCIQGALLHQDANLAWNLYQELLDYKLIPVWETFKAFFDFGRGMKDDQYTKKLLDILLYLRNNRLYPEESFAHSIKNWFESVPGEQWQAQFTTVHKSGQCLGCGKTIESSQLSSEEYDYLKGKIMMDVIDGGDQYKKTTPQELQRFKNFVKTCPPFDIVIDGLNVAKMFPKTQESQSLLDVVSQLSEMNLRLLVLGRKHMLMPSSRWRKDTMKKVQKLASCFFADNISEDDPFLLYATLHSGNHCKFVTNDLMRDHKACLPDVKTQSLFFKWQQGHQLAIIKKLPGSKVVFQPILSYDTVVQTTGDSWHIPYDDDQVERYSFEVPTKWLCLHRKS
ncbi:mitochondrial ribonuclease P catalytic subunit [Suncus etruscus]|uniref:mitochondrial ribonuclease P catalytic subunit n=1 Tax=Suncus etruscus TaxID=109475 RepID=UPI0021100E99|nr:mitochondrial ribonuclease P catalytic subunit [Suncus etruscus]